MIARCQCPAAEVRTHILTIFSIIMLLHLFTGVPYFETLLQFEEFCVIIESSPMIKCQKWRQ